MTERHEIYELLGSGGFASVYRGHDTQLGRDVAIKRLKSESYADHLQLRDQLLSEAKVLAGLRHPNIVTIHDVIETDDGGDIVMELIKGSTLEDVVKHVPIEVSQFLFIATQLLSAMATAHENGVLHGDLKPVNVMLTELGDSNYQATLIDFGVSPSLDTDKPVSQSKEHKLVGSIYFMAPEQLESNLTSPQSDIYALGCLFYYMLAGAHPFQGDSAVMVMASHMSNRFTPLNELRDDLPESLCLWVESHLRLIPEERIESCRLSLDELFQLKGLKALDNFSEIHKQKDMTRTGIIQSLCALSQAKVQISDQQLKEFSRHKIPKTNAPDKERKPLAARYQQARPESLWYFSINDARKGPVHFSKICELIAQGYVRSNDPIWHPRIGQWTPAIEVSEFHEEFQAAKKMPPRPQKTKRVSARNTAHVAASSKKTQLHSHQSQRKRVTRESSTPPVEIALTVAFSVIAMLAIFLMPSFWQLILLVYAGLLALSALILSRFYMLSINRKWLAAGIFFPILSDIIFACAKPKKGMQCIVMLTLALACFFYAAQHRYADDYLTSSYISGVTAYFENL